MQAGNQTAARSIPKTGDVAVANNVTTYYTPPGSWLSVNSVGYDNKGNAFIAGSDGFEGNPGNVQLDGKYVTCADANSGTAYRGCYATRIIARGV